MDKKIPANQTLDSAGRPHGHRQPLLEFIAAADAEKSRAFKRSLHASMDGSTDLLPFIF
jgi:hypothetical protein